MTGKRHATLRGSAVAPTFQAALGLLRQGRSGDAAALLQDVLQADPQHFGALCSLARLHFERGAPASALPLIEAALRVQPDSADAHHAQACFLQAVGRLDEAIAAFETAIRLRPGFADAHSNLGGLYSEQRRYDLALAQYEQALAGSPAFAEARNNMGVALLALDRPQAALDQFARALALRPAFAEAQGNAGSSLIALGRIDEARAAFEAAIRLAPRRGQFYLDLARCRAFAADDPQDGFRIAAMHRLAAEAGSLPAADRIPLHFALAKALADTGQIEPSFRHLRQGNALQRAQVGYDEAPALATMQRLRQSFTAELLRSRAGRGDGSERPVFVIGMPRSGTTLVEQILASHPAVFGAGERPDLQQAALAAAGAARHPATLFERIASLPDDRLRQLGAAYLRAVDALAPDAPRIIDKMPGNFLHVGTIALALPQARIIHVRRDPVDTCLSCFATLFSGHQPYAYNLAELGRYYRAYDALMRHWRAIVPSELMLELRYEDLVADIEGETRRMLAHCRLDWDERCLRFHTTPRSVQTASRVQVRQPLYRSSLGRAKAYGHLLDPLLQALGDAA